MSTGPLDQVISLTLQVNNQEAVRKLRDDQAALKAQLEALPAAYAKGGISATEYERSLKTLGNDYERITNLVKRYDQAIADEAAALAAQAAALAKAESAAYDLASAEYKLADEMDHAEAEILKFNASLARAASEAKIFVNALAQAAAQARSLDPVEHALADIANNADRAADNANRVATNSRKMGDSLDRSGKSTGNLAYSFLNFSRATQDFAQGGFAGIINNIEGIFTGLPGKLAALATPATIVGTAAFVIYQNWNSIRQIWTTTVPLIDANANSLEGLESALKKNSKAMEDLRAKQRLTADELREYNKLSKDQLQIEKDIAELREIEAAKKRFGPEQGEREQEVQKAGADAINRMGGFDRVTQQIAAEVLKARQRNGDEISTIDVVLRQVQLQMTKVLTEGNEKWLRNFRDDTASPMGQIFGGMALNVFDPRKVREREEQAKIAKQGQEAEDAAMAETVKKAQADARLGEELTRQGVENEAAMRTRMDDAAQGNAGVRNMLDLAAQFGIDLTAPQQAKQSAQDRNAQAMASAFDAIQQGTNGNVSGHAAAAAAGRAVELQNKGMTEQESANQAVMELMNGMLILSARQLTNVEAQIVHGQRLASKVDQLGQAVARQSAKVRTLLSRPVGN